MVETPNDASSRSARAGRLALRFQEAFTVIVRLRTSRQVAADGQSFREHMKQLLLAADRDARSDGYDPAVVRLAVYAVIAFLDESVLLSQQSMFAEWPRQPLQEEVFGDHRAGETFFERLRELLARPDTLELADLLEVYLLCLHLGYRGRYAAESGELHAITASTREKVARIHGLAGEFAPHWAPPADEEVPAEADAWIRRLAIIAGAGVALTVVLFVIYMVVLNGRVDRVLGLAAGGGP